MYLSSHDMLTPSIDNSLLNIETIFLQNMRESAKKKKKKVLFLAPQGHEKLQVPRLLWQECNSEHSLLARLQFPPVFNFFGIICS